LLVLIAILRALFFHNSFRKHFLDHWLNENFFFDGLFKDLSDNILSLLNISLVRMLFCNDRNMFLFYQGSMLLMDDRLMVLMNVLLINDRLLVLMNDVLMMFMEDILLMLN